MGRNTRAICAVVSQLLLAGMATDATAQLVNVAPTGTATQTSNYPCCGGFPAPLAIDLNLGNFTATAPDDPAPSWQVELPEIHDLRTIVVHNRGDGCCQSRLRDIVVSIHDVSFRDDPAAVPLYESEILNEENSLGGGTLAGPALLEVEISPPVTGRYVRVMRIPDPDLSGTGGAGVPDEVAVHSIGEVEVFGNLDATCPNPGNIEFADTHCTLLTVEEPVGGGPGVYTLTASGTDATLDDLFYVFRAENGFNPPIVVGPTVANSAQITILAGGSWTFSVTVDDSLLCADTAADATCTRIVAIPLPPGANKALLRPTRQSSDFNSDLTAPLAADGLLTNFTATASGDASATWDVNLVDDIDVRSIVIYNRGDGCCQSRLRDITVSILDPTATTVLFETELLNPENVLGGGTLAGPPILTVDVVALTGGAVRGRIVRVKRDGDPDLSGTGGQGNADEANVLSLGEVEVYDSACGEGVARCAGLLVEGPDGSGPGNYTLTATASVDPAFYTFSAQRGQEPPVVVGPTDVPVAVFNLGVGEWTLRAAVGDTRQCANTAPGATCTESLTVAALCQGTNVARDGTATQTTNYPCCGGLPAPLANDGDPGTFTATAPDDLAPAWQVDLGTPRTISTIVLYNRADGCCPERLRDITVSILDGAGAEIEFQSELLNPGNTLGGPPYLILDMQVLVGGPVVGQIVRVSRTPDPSGIGDDAAILTLAEVEVCTDAPSPAPKFHRADVDDNGSLQLTDAVRILGYLFLGATAPTCLDSADADGNGVIQLTDAVRILGYLFLGGLPPAPPGPPDQPCGADADAEDPDLGCGAYVSC